MPTPQLDVLGLKELAELMNVTTGNLSVMRARGQIVEPDAVLKCGPVWRRSTVSRWLKSRARVAAK
jgi:hypothetical protein